MTEGAPELVEFERRLDEITEAPSPADVLDRLLEATALAAPRAALLVVRRGRLRGIRCVGYPTEAMRRLARFDVDASRGWLAPVVSGEARTVLPRDPASTGPDFGQSPGAESAAAAVRAGGATISVIVAERDEGELPWSPTVLAVLSRLASQRLEVDLARRRVPAAAPVEASPADEREAPEEAPTLAPPPPVVTARTIAIETGLTPIEEAERADRPRSKASEARRFARLVATDIRLYHEEDVILGRRRGDLAQRLGDELERGRQSFTRRFPDLGSAGLAILDDAYVDVLAGGDRSLLPPSA